MESSQHDESLVEALRAGNDQAAAEIFARYAERLGRLADRHLNARLRARVDGDDIVQSVMQTFFKRVARGEFQIDNGARIWQLLVHITIMRVRAKARYHTAEMRDVRADAQGSAAISPADFAAREPDPAEAAMLVETMEALVGDLPPFYCQVLDLRLQGFAAAEIAEQLNVSRRTVYRALELLQQRLTRQAADASSIQPTPDAQT